MAAAHAAALHVQLASMDVSQIVQQTHNLPICFDVARARRCRGRKRYTSAAISLVQAHVRAVSIDR
jgi:hypothetical protein